MRSYGPTAPNARPSSTSERSSTSIRNSAALAAAHAINRTAAVRTMRSSLAEEEVCYSPSMGMLAVMGLPVTMPATRRTRSRASELT